MRNRRWVYVKTGPAPKLRAGHGRGPNRDEGEPPSERARVLSVSSTYTVEMPDGTIRDVTDEEILRHRRKPDPVTVKAADRVGRSSHTATTESHPRFGMIGVYHQSGGSGRIFGSRVDTHQHKVAIRVTRGATCDHDLGQDWYHGGGDVIVEVELSAARFSELLAAPNRGDGVPCSITYHSSIPGPGMVPSFPARDSEVRKIVDRVRGLGTEMRERAAGNRAALEQVLAKIPKSRREEALRLFDDAYRLADDSAPFLVKSAVEALENATSDAKHEVEAFVSARLTQLGSEVVAEEPERLLPDGFTERPTAFLDVDADEEGPG